MKVVSFILFVLLAMVGVLALFTVGPILETKYFPVYSKFRIVRAEPVEGGVRIVARFTKYRNCDPQGYGWYVGELGLLRQVMTRPTPGATVHRPLGPQITSPIVVKELTMADLPYLSAEMYHHCHPLWLTRSVIYP